jgi:ribosome recycling factor
MVRDLIEKNKPELEKAIEYFKDELTQLRTGRASSALVENLMVDYYGSKSPLKQVANISIPEPRSILISPWSKDTLINIEKSIRDSQLNLNPINDGQVLRVNIPPLNEERRKELVKILGQKAEEARVTVRKNREAVWDEIQSLEKQGKIGEDEKFSGKDHLQKVIDEFNKIVDEIKKKKEEEIMTI